MEMSPSMRKFLLATLFLLPWFSLYSKILFPSLAQAGFEHSVFILVELIFVLFVSIFCKHPTINKLGCMFILAILAWQLSGVVSAFLSDHFHASLIKQVEIFIHCLTGYSAWVLINQFKKNDQLIFALCITLAWVLYYILTIWHRTENADDYDWVRGTILFNNIRHSGYVLAAIFPLLYFPLIKNIKYNYLITLSLLTAYWTFTLWSGSRGTFIASLITLLGIYYFFPNIRKKILSITSIAFLLGWLLSIAALANHEVVNPFRLLFLDFILSSKEISTHAVSGGRSTIWSATINAAIEAGIPFGLAPDGYKFVTPHIWPGSTQPHSAPVQLISEYGIIGFSILTILGMLFISHWIKNPGESTHKLARLALVCICIASATDGHFYYNFSLLLIALISALSFYSVKRETKKNIIGQLTLVAITLILLIPLKKHWQSFIEQQFPLTHASQLKSVKSFPSFYLPKGWLYNFDSDPDLREEAVQFGKLLGPNQCNYYLMEYFESNNDQSLLPSIKNICAPSILHRTRKIELINIAKEQGFK